MEQTDRRPALFGKTAVGGIALSLLLLLGGCAPSAMHCDPSSIRSGYVCYNGINFGKSDDPLYRAGVQDGCETGKGYFRKNYRYSGSSEAYRQGWTKGRTLCRPSTS